MIIKEMNIKWKTTCNDKLNLDSVTSWKNNILVSSKDKHKIFGYDKVTGKLKFEIGDKGYDYDKLKRPSGITVINDYLFVIERDNNRCQVFNLNNKKSIAFFGFKKLKKPYGISGFFSKNQYVIFISDNELDTVFKFNLTIDSNEIKKINSSIFIELPGSSLESLYIDDKRSKILVTEGSRKKIKVFNYDKILEYEIDNISNIKGISMSENSYILADQKDDTAYFHMYDTDAIKYKFSLNSHLIKNINSVHYIDGYLYLIDNECSLFKMEYIDKSNITFYPVIILGGLVALFNIMKK